ncbi:MAG: bifunctional diguanylate cyclase/phosphodiesterase [Lachnospiraceae bacterium]|nr:bifunctional diguanylate cyclase/phosphodiesterase [Lachnospiraceae bacterium]
MGGTLSDFTINFGVAFQIAFLMLEAGVCFSAAIFMASRTSMAASRKHLITVLNSFAGILLLNDSMAYLFRGRAATINFVMVRLANGIVFIFTDLIILVYIMFISYELFGTYGLSRKNPARLQIGLAYAMMALGVILVVISQFNGMYYTFDENNVYHRQEPMYIVANVIPAVGVILVFTVLVQYRKHVKPIKWLILSSCIILSSIAVAFQSFHYGVSYLNIALGISFLMMFVESVMSQAKEIMRVSRTEIRTGLLNEHGCIEQLNSMRNTQEIMEYASVFIDIEKFSTINRKYGMDAGNEVLVKYGEIILQNLNKDEYLGRQGSDLFIAIIRKKNVDRLLKLLEGIIVSFGGDKKTGEGRNEVVLSAACGVFEINETDLSGEDILSNAYLALNHAKTVIKKPVAFMTSELRDSIDEKKLFELQIPKALEDNEFVPYYQPKVNLKTKTLCGAEALARWIHNGVLISPGKFIPMMEINDSICDLDFSILKMVCQDLDEWIKEGLNPPPVSVNFSRRNLSNPGLAEDIDRIVSDYRIPKKLIEIEITETNDEFPISVLKNFVQEMHKRGYRTAIDDFGCGSSSLSVLREITFDVLKIDKEFVDNAYAKDLTILSYIIKMAKAISLEVVAEGVEQKDQVNTLSSLGADVIQGYYYDKPLAKETMQQRLINKSYE